MTFFGICGIIIIELRKELKMKITKIYCNNSIQSRASPSGKAAVSHHKKSSVGAVPT